jgi:hypothetical protein
MNVFLISKNLFYSMDHDMKNENGKLWYRICKFEIPDQVLLHIEQIIRFFFLIPEYLRRENSI